GYFRGTVHLQKLITKDSRRKFCRQDLTHKMTMVHSKMCEIGQQNSFLENLVGQPLDHKMTTVHSKKGNARQQNRV
ncbi:hypothetical protein, partial [Parasediminibacterium sp. JCM 36343]|uniref:hypothetical protein n=1 Tax=Parasediminibacterium sp. JCM 36343 TaxID=3374279 RepID=UPI00397A7C63